MLLDEYKFCRLHTYLGQHKIIQVHYFLLINIIDGKFLLRIPFLTELNLSLFCRCRPYANLCLIDTYAAQKNGEIGF